MDWLSDLAQWFLITKAGLVTGTVTIWLLIVVAFVWAVWRFGDVRMTEPEIPEKPLSEATTVVLVQRPVEAPLYTAMDDYWQPMSEFVYAINETAAAVIDLTDTVELRPVDPLAATTELEHIDPSVPLFYTIKRPKQFELETFTQGWSAERIQRIKEMKP